MRGQVFTVMYSVILLVAVNTLSFTIGGSRFTEHGDNAIPKFLYWPVLLGSFFAISLGFLY